MKSQHDFKAFTLRDRTNVQHLASIRKSRIISNILAYLNIAFFSVLIFFFQCLHIYLSILQGTHMVLLKLFSGFSLESFVQYA